MEVTASNGTLTIRGNIKSLEDFETIKSHIEREGANRRAVRLDIVDSISITSTLIGYLTKLSQHDGIEIHMNIGNRQLIRLLDDLNLSGLFHVRFKQFT